jgi:BASS family bile acid:Na+ symporter
MDLAKLILLGLKASVALIVFGLGLKATPADLSFLFRRPSLFARSLLSMNVVMPLLVTAMVALLQLRPPVEIALVVLAISPVPPILPRKQSKLGGNQSYIYGLLAAEAVLSIALIPLAIKLLAAAFGLEARMPWPAVAAIVLETVLLPLGAGIAVRHLAPSLGARIEPLITRVGGVLLLAAAIPILFSAGRAVVSLIGNGTLIAIAIVVLLGLAVGHLLGGPEPADRAVLALATASRHPGVAMAIAASTFPGQKLVPAAILLYLLVNGLLCLPYMIWSKRQFSEIAEPARLARDRDKAA